MKKNRKNGMVLATAIASMLVAAPVMARAAPQSEGATHATYAFNMPAESLSVSLHALGRQAHINIVFDPAQVAGLKSAALDGDYPLKQALARLLAGTHLAATFVDATTVVIKPRRRQHRQPGSQQPGSVDTVRVVPQAQSPEQARTLNQVSVTGYVSGLTATRSETALRDIPQTVSVISRQMLDQQNATTLAKALRYQPGITIEQNNSQQSYIYSRGFQVKSIHIDGGAPIQVATGSINAVGITSRDMAEYGNIEVLRGSDALFGGMGNPGASVSMNRKVPTDYFQQKYTASAGSWDNYRIMADVSGPLSDKWSARGVVTGTTSHYSYDIAHRREYMAYGVLKYEFNPAASIVFGGSYQHSSGVNNYQGLPRYDTGEDPHLPRSLSLVAPWATVATTFKEAFAKFDYEFSEDWNLHVGSTYLSEGMPNEITTHYKGPIDSTTGLLKTPLSSIVNTMNMTQKMVDATLTGSFDWLGHEQRIMVGGDYGISTYDADMRQPYKPDLPLIDPFHYDPGIYPLPDFSIGNLKERIRWHSKSKQWGIYTAFKFVPMEDLAITIGGRQNGYSSSSLNQTDLYYIGLLGDPSRGHLSITGKFTPYAGITYDIGEHYTVYASFADIYRSNGEVYTKEGKRLPPSDGDTKEIGLKGAWFDNTFNASFSFFKVNQHGNAVLQTYSWTRNRCCYTTASIKARGVQLSASGALTPHWQISGGLTHEKHRTISSAFVRQRPRNMVKIWTNYVLPGGQWNIGGGVVYKSRNWSKECTIFEGGCQKFVKFGQGAHAVYTLRTAYAFNPHITLALNINNVTDVEYYKRVASLSGGNWYGNPRNYMLKLIANF